MDNSFLFALATMIINTAPAEYELREIAPEDDLIEDCAEWLKQGLDTRQELLIRAIAGSLLTSYAEKFN